MTTTQEEVEKLVAEGKLKEAREGLKKLLATPETDEDKAQARVLLAKLYMEVMNRINREELRVVDAMIDAAHLLDKAEGEGKRRVGISKAKEALHSAYKK